MCALGVASESRVERQCAPLRTAAAKLHALALPRCRVLQVFGSAKPHHAYCLANRRATRLKVLVHDGIGIWLAARRLHQGGFVWPTPGVHTASVRRGQFDALAPGRTTTPGTISKGGVDGAYKPPTAIEVVVR